jgi:hypothetical protein
MGNKALTPEEQYVQEQEAIDKCMSKIKKAESKKGKLMKNLMETINQNFFGEWETTHDGVDLTIVASKGQLKLKNKNEHTVITIINFIDYNNIQVRFEDEEQTIAIFQYIEETDTLKMITEQLAEEEILWVRVVEESTVEGLFIKRYS